MLQLNRMLYRFRFAWTVLVIGLLAGCLPTQAAQAPGGATALSAQPAATQAPQPPTSPAQPAQARAAVPTPDCSNLALTPSETEGPYYKAGSPERASLLEPGIAGTKIVVTGYVLTPDCKPVAGAWLDFWQADANGNYDNTGYRLRGHQVTDASGRYQLTTIVPGLYPGRTEHIHVKVRAPNGPTLATQLYFPGVPNNQSDGIFDPKLLLTMSKTGDGLLGTYNFVVNAQ